MLMIRSIIRPEKVDDTLAALMEAGFPAVTKMSVVGRGKQRGIKIGEITYDEIPKELLITVIPSKDKDYVIRTIIKAAKTGEKGAFGEAVYQRSPHRGDYERGPDMNRDIYYYRESDLKVIYRANLDSWEMYDLKEDPKESSNIIAESPHAEALKSRLMLRVKRWQKK